MNEINRKFQFALVAIAGSIALAACGGGDGGDDSKTLQQTTPNEPLVPQLFGGVEDSPLQGVLSAKNLPPGNYHFEVVQEPTHGTVAVNAATGDFSYVPNKDFFGADTFDYRITRTVKRPVRGRVIINLSNVNDAPALAAIADMMNSPETRETTYAVPTIDVDGDALQISATSDDSSVATVAANSSDRTILIAPGVRGTSKIRVTVTDGALSTEQVFNFTVGDVIKARTVAADMAAGDALTLTNTLNMPVVFKIEHNGFPMFQSKAEMVEYVRNMPPVRTGEPFEHKLWRFVRNNMYHNVPLTADKWFYDPWAMINSQGWGFCGHAAAVYVHLAREAGYEARVWGLTGHVIPEIRIDGTWMVYDPDLAVYYHTADGRIANVADLSADSSLVTAPVNPLLPAYSSAYTQDIAGYYESPGDNFDGEDTFLAEEEARFQPVTMPPNSQLTYPGRWTAEVIGVDGKTPYPLTHYLQAMLTTPAEFAGNVPLPWMLWEVRGNGSVRIDGTTYSVGSAELTELLMRPRRQLVEVEVISSTTPLEFIFFVNALRYTLEPINQVNIEGKDVWAISFATSQLPPEARADPALAQQVQKPRP